MRQIFQVTLKLISDQTEITGLTTIDWQQPTWRETSLLTDIGHSWGLGRKRNGTEPMSTNLMENGIKLLTFAESGHPVFRATSALE